MSKQTAARNAVTEADKAVEAGLTHGLGSPQCTAALNTAVQAMTIADAHGCTPTDYQNARNTTR